MEVLCVVLSVVLAVGAQTLAGPKHGKHVICHIASWSVYRPHLGQFNLEDLEPALCTHLVYSFAGLDETTNTIKSLNPYEDLESDFGMAAYRRLVAFKKQYPHLKVILSVGGWDDGSLKYSNMASKNESRASFTKSVVEMLNNYEFDGLDLHWKFPTKRDGKPYDKANFVTLAKDLSEAFEPRGYILMASLGATKSVVETAYDFPKLSGFLDLMLVLCYDYHGHWSRVVGANAPMKGVTKSDHFSVEYTINYILSQGVPPSKIILGVALFGRTFILSDPGTPAVKFGTTPTTGIGFHGPYTREDGFMGYNEICEDYNKNSSSWTYHWDENSSTPYLHDKERVIVYDNGRSIAAKVKMAMDKELGGIMVWTIDTDDFRGNCNETNAYIDFVDRYQAMAHDPLLMEAQPKLNLIHHKSAPNREPFYVLKYNRLFLRVPQPRYSKYSLMQTINDAISLSIEEKRIEDEMAKIPTENEIPLYTYLLNILCTHNE